MASSKRDIEQLLKVLRSQGCEVTLTRNGHWRVSRPGCNSVTVARTPSDPRALKNAKADIRRAFGVAV